MRPRGLGLEPGLETCGLATYGLGLDDFRIRGLGLGLGPGERGLGLGLATMRLDYIFVSNRSKHYDDNTVSGFS